MDTNAKTWIKIADGISPEKFTRMINPIWYSRIEQVEGNPSHTKFAHGFDLTGASDIVVELPIATVIAYMNPILIREDELGNSL